MTILPSPTPSRKALGSGKGEQNSAYDSTWRGGEVRSLPLCPLSPVLGAGPRTGPVVSHPVRPCGCWVMTKPTSSPERAKPYPDTWEQVADLRVFRTTAEDWERLITWRTDMRRAGWKLLRVTTDEVELVAVFGKTKSIRRS